MSGIAHVLGCQCDLLIRAHPLHAPAVWAGEILAQDCSLTAHCVTAPPAIAVTVVTPCAPVRCCP